MFPATTGSDSTATPPGLIVPDLDEAVRAFLALDAWQLPVFCSRLAERGIYVNIGIAHYVDTAVGIPLAPQE